MEGKAALRNSYLWGPIIQVMFLITVSQTDMTDVEFYLFLFLLLAVWIFFFKLDNPRLVVLESERYNLGNVVPQAFIGTVIGIVIASPVFFFGSYIGIGFGEAFFQIFFVANVETLWMICIVRMMQPAPLGVYLWPLLFAIAHPVVRTNWFSGQFPLASFTGFLYALLMGILFYMLWQGYRVVPKSWKPFFGPVTPWATHATINIIVSVFLFTIGGLTLIPI